MKYTRLAHKNGKIKEYFEYKVEKRTRVEYTPKKEKEILRNMLTDTDSAITYVNRVKEIKTSVRAKILSVLGFEVDVGFDPNATTNGISNQVSELTEALNMILEGVTE